MELHRITAEWHVHSQLAFFHPRVSLVGVGWEGQGVGLDRVTGRAEPRLKGPAASGQRRVQAHSKGVRGVAADRGEGAVRVVKRRGRKLCQRERSREQGVAGGPTNKGDG